MGLMSATARAAYYGFTGHGEVTTTFHPETGFKDVNVYVELVARARSWRRSSPIRRRWWPIASFCSMRSNTGSPHDCTPFPRRTRRPCSERRCRRGRDGP